MAWRLGGRVTSPGQLWRLGGTIRSFAKVLFVSQKFFPARFPNLRAKNKNVPRHHVTSPGQPWRLGGVEAWWRGGLVAWRLGGVEAWW